MAGRPSKPGTVRGSRSGAEESVAEAGSALAAGVFSDAGSPRRCTRERSPAKHHTREHRNPHHGADGSLMLAQPAGDAVQRIHAPSPRPGGILRKA